MSQQERKYHGWIIVEDDGEGFKDYIWAEWLREDGLRERKDMGRGESGAAVAVEFWDNKVGQSIKLESYGRIGYRVYTEAVNA